MSTSSASWQRDTITPRYKGFNDRIHGDTIKSLDIRASMTEYMVTQ
jgi:hypothetical protein